MEGLGDIYLLKCKLQKIEGLNNLELRLKAGGSIPPLHANIIIEISKGIKMDYNEIVKVVHEQNWKFTQLIIGLSVGIIAFSIQSLSKDVEYNFIFLIFISWSSFFISFIFGLIRLHHIQAVTTRNATAFFKKEVRKEEVPVDEEKLRLTNRRSAKLYRVMLLFFIIGIISFALFKIFNL